MAVQNDPRMYSGGAVVLDSSPSVNLYSQLLSKKQAKIDALDEYDRQRINNINPNGVRDVDREGFDKRVQQIQEFYQGNKDKIRKGGTPEAYAFEKMFRDVGSYVNQSKERTAKQEAAMKLYHERLKQDGRIPDDFIAELSENDAGVDQLTGIDPQTGKPRSSRSLDLKKWLSQPKPFNQQTYLKGFSDIKRDKIIYSDIPNEPLKQNEISQFGKDALSVIHARAADKYQNSFSFAEQVKSEYTDPVARRQMEEIFVKQYGTPPQTMDDYAAAFTLKLIQPEVVKPVDNSKAIIEKNQQFAKEQQARAYSNSISKMYQYFNLLEASDRNITEKAEELYDNNFKSRDPQTGEVPTNDETKEAIFGKKGGVMIIDNDGNYVRATKDVDGKLTPTGEKASKEEAIIRIRGSIKNNLPKKVQPGNKTTIPKTDIKKKVKIDW